MKTAAALLSIVIVMIMMALMMWAAMEDRKRMRDLKPAPIEQKVPTNWDEEEEEGLELAGTVWDW